MKRFYRVTGIVTMPTVTLNPTFIGQPMTVGISEPGQWQIRCRYGNRQFWLIASHKGLKEFFDLSVREQMGELDRLLGKRNASPVFFGTQQQSQQPQDPAFTPTEWACSCGKDKIHGKYCPNCGASKPEPKFWICSKCGSHNAEGDKFCENCGTAQPQPEADRVGKLENTVSVMAQQIAALQQTRNSGNP